MLMENLADGAGIARQLLRQPNIAAPLPLQLGPYQFSYVRKLIHSVAFCGASPLKSNHKKAWKLFALPFTVDLLDYQPNR